MSKIEKLVRKGPFWVKREMNAEDLTCSICLGLAQNIFALIKTAIFKRKWQKMCTAIFALKFSPDFVIVYWNIPIWLTSEMRVIDEVIIFWVYKEIFKPPIRMTDACGHNFCHNYLLSIINEENEWLCPVCRSEQSKRPDELMRNRLVERAVESFNISLNQNEATSLCSYHNLELSLCKFNIANQIPSEYIV